MVTSLAEKYGYVCLTIDTIHHEEQFGTNQFQMGNCERSSSVEGNVTVAGVVNYFISTPMSTLALVVGPKMLIPKEIKTK